MTARAALPAVVLLLVLAASASAGKPRLGRVPRSCPGATGIPMSEPPAPWPRLAGSSPLWLGIYARVRPQKARITVRQSRFYRRRKRGWPIKFLWVMPRTQTAPITVSLRRLATGRRAWIHLGGLYNTFTREPVLDPAHPGHPDDPNKPDTHEWGSLLYFPRAGCYRFAASWKDGDAGFVFGFGRPR